MKRICKLKPLQSKDTHSIRLDAGETTIGRSRQTGIRDVRCSQKQIQLHVDLECCEVRLKATGTNPCGLNGLMITQNTECELKHGDVIELVYGRHGYRLVFMPLPSASARVEASPAKSCSSEAESAKKASPIEEAAKTTADSVACTVEAWSSAGDGKLVIFNSAGLRPSTKVAGYDMDGTIIKTKSGNVMPKNTEDWQLLFPAVRTKLKALHDDGFKICFFTNQKGISNGKTNLEDFKKKIKDIVRALDTPIQVFIAIGGGYFRKPRPGMWEHFEREANGGLKPDLRKCFFVGDAAGRPELGKGALKRRKDHSLADRLFAANIGVEFYTPEEHFFGGRKELWNEPEFDPRWLHADVPLYVPVTTNVPAVEGCELIVMVGLPGSGKSHYCREVLAPLGYVIISADILGSMQVCQKACERALEARKPCVIDNTNVDVPSRKKFVELAAKAGVPCRSFVMTTTVAQVKHNLIYRELVDSNRPIITNMVFNTMKKKYVPPIVDEGFSEIVGVNFKPKFNSDEAKSLYSLYLVEN